MQDRYTRSDEEHQAAWTDALDSLIQDGYIEQNEQEQVRLTDKGWYGMHVLEQLQRDSHTTELLNRFQSMMEGLGFVCVGDGIFTRSREDPADDSHSTGNAGTTESS